MPDLDLLRVPMLRVKYLVVDCKDTKASKNYQKKDKLKLMNNLSNNTKKYKVINRKTTNRCRDFWID